MIPFNFDYYKPQTISEALHIFSELDAKGKEPIYYSGGTEILTLGRLDLLYTEAVIDIKHIPESRMLSLVGEDLKIGSQVSLTQVIESEVYPLLSKTANQIADRTVRNKITVGGNICGYIYFREAVLPFLLADSRAAIAGPSGIRTVDFTDFFYKRPHFKKGEFLVYIITNHHLTKQPFFSEKVRKQGTVGYPLVTLAALKVDGMFRLAISGLCPYPFRPLKMEAILNQKSMTLEERWQLALDTLPKEDILDDIEGSSEYRLFRLKQLIFKVFTNGGE